MLLQMLLTLLGILLRMVTLKLRLNQVLIKKECQILVVTILDGIML